MKKQLKKCLHAILPALMLWAPAMASSVRSVTGFRSKKTVIHSVVSSDCTQNLTIQNDAEKDPFTVFGNTITMDQTHHIENNTEILDFLNKEGLLFDKNEKPSSISGDVHAGRKNFTATACTYFGNIYPCTNQQNCEATSSTQATSSNAYYCSGNWVVTAPVIETSSVSNITSTGFTLDIDISHTGTVYAVAVLRTSTAPNSAQVKAGQDGTGATASASGSTALNTSGSITLNVSNADQNLYNVYFIAEDGDGMSDSPSVHNVLTTTSYTQKQVISFGNTWANPDIEKYGSNFYIFHESASNTCRISSWNGTSWVAHSTNLTADGANSMNAQKGDMVIDGSGNFHVLINRSMNINASSGDMYHNMYNGTDWSGFTRVYNGSSSPDSNTGSVDFAYVDGSDKIHLTFEVSDTMHYATNASDSWVITNLEGGITNSNNERWTLVESGGTAHTFYDNNQQDLRTANSSDGFASKSNIINTSNSIQVGNVIIDGSNKFHLVYSNTSNGTAYYMTNSSGNWAQEQIISSGFTDIEAKYVMLYGSDVYVLMFNDTENLFYFKRKVSGSWSEGNFFSAGNGHSITFAIDTTNDIIYIPFQPDLGSIQTYIEPIGNLFGSANNNPTITVANGTYTENDSPAIIDSGATASDSDGDGDWDTNAKLEVQISTNAESTDEISIDTSGNFSISAPNLSYSGTTIGTISETSGTANDGTVTGSAALTINFNSNATNAIVQTLASSIAYRSTSDNPTGTNTTRTLTFTLTDKNSGSGNDTSVITITPLNDAPTDISLSNASVSEEQSSGTAVGTLTTTDPDN